MKYFHAFFLRQTRFSNFSLKQNKLIFEIFLISPPEQRARQFGKWWSDVLYFSIKFSHNRIFLVISPFLACFWNEKHQKRSGHKFSSTLRSTLEATSRADKGMLMWMAWMNCLFRDRVPRESCPRPSGIAGLVGWGVSAVKKFEFIMPRVFGK